MASPAHPGYNRLKISYPILREKITGMYKCTLCPYKSSHRSSVRSHYAVHSNARPYACDMCEYEAKRLTDLKKHKVLRHGQDLTAMRLKSRKKYASFSCSTIISEGDLDNPYSEGPSVHPGPALVENIDPDEHNIDAMLDYHAKIDSGAAYDQGRCLEASGDHGAAFPVNDLNPMDHELGQCVRKQAETREGGITVKQEPVDDGFTPNESGEDDHKERSTEVSPNTESLTQRQSASEGALSDEQLLENEAYSKTATATDARKNWHCPYCNITYYDGAMYVMHAGLHNTDNPWMCNLCGRQFFDVYGFTSHFVNGHYAHRD